MKVKGPYLTLLAGVILASVLLVLSSAAAAPKTPAQVAVAVTTGSPAPPSKAPTASTPPAVTQAAYAGLVTGGGATIAIAVKDGKAVAYLCDGKRTEAWMKGTAVDGKLTLAGAANARLTGTYASSAAGQVVAGGRTYSFAAPTVKAPSGLYRAVANVRNAKVVGGWIVLPDGSQVGIVTTDGQPTAAPRLDIASRAASVGGTSVSAVPQDGSGF